MSPVRAFRFVMTRFRIISTAFCLLSLWLQMLVPAAALAMRNAPVDPFAVICHGAGATSDHDNDSVPAQHTPACDHCLLCHALTGGLSPDDEPLYAVLDFPVSGPARWHAVDQPHPAARPEGEARPRGPPSTI